MLAVVIVALIIVQFLSWLWILKFHSTDDHHQFEKSKASEMPVIPNYPCQLKRKPPYPYCPDDVLFPVEYLTVNTQITYVPRWLRSATVPEDAILKDQLLANDSLGG